MAAPALLVTLVATTVCYFVAGLGSYVAGVKRADERVVAAGRTLTKTAPLPVAGAIGSILLPRALPATVLAALGPLGLGAVVVCLLAPPLLALASGWEAKEPRAES